MTDLESEKIRLDMLLLKRGLTPSRSRSRDSIIRGAVRVDGKTVTKPGQLVSENSKLELNDPADGYVSRSALKLVAGLDYFDLDPTGCVCIDIGASTGGFTQVLLERNAKSVYALDVGHGQLDEKLKADPRVISFEGVNARNLSANLFDSAPQFLVCDVSFISIKLAIKPALEIVSPNAHGLFLIKPQFEVGKNLIGKGGIVPRKNGEKVSQEIKSWIDSLNDWQSIGVIPSPICGSDGNLEYLLAAKRIMPKF